MDCKLSADTTVEFREFLQISKKSFNIKSGSEYRLFVSFDVLALVSVKEFFKIFYLVKYRSWINYEEYYILYSGLKRF